MEDNHIPLLQELGVGTFYRTTHSGRKVVVTVVDPYGDAKTTDAKKELRDIAKTTKTYRFGWINGVQWPEFVDQIGIYKENFPQTLVIDAPNKIHFVHRNTSWNTVEFLQAVQEEKVDAEGDGASWVSFLTPGPTAAMVLVGVLMVGLTLAFSETA